MLLMLNRNSTYGTIGSRYSMVCTYVTGVHLDDMTSSVLTLPWPHATHFFGCWGSIFKNILSLYFPHQNNIVCSFMQEVIFCFIFSYFFFLVVQNFMLEVYMSVKISHISYSKKDSTHLKSFVILLLHSTSNCLKFIKCFISESF